MVAPRIYYAPIRKRIGGWLHQDPATLRIGEAQGCFMRQSSSRLAGGSRRHIVEMLQFERPTRSSSTWVMCLIVLLDVGSFGCFLHRLERYTSVSCWHLRVRRCLQGLRTLQDMRLFQVKYTNQLFWMPRSMHVETGSAVPTRSSELRGSA